MGGRAWAVAVLILVGSGLLLYPDAASWFSAVNQAKVLEEYGARLENAVPAPSEQLQQAAAYNAALDAGVLLEAGERKPTGAGTSHADGLDYDSILSVDGSGIMGRVKVPVIGVDLPIYHGTSDATLLRGGAIWKDRTCPSAGRARTR